MRALILLLVCAAYLLQSAIAVHQCKLHALLEISDDSHPTLNALAETLDDANEFVAHHKVIETAEDKATIQKLADTIDDQLEAVIKLKVIISASSLFFISDSLRDLFAYEGVNSAALKEKMMTLQQQNDLLLAAVRPKKQELLEEFKTRIAIVHDRQAQLEEFFTEQLTQVQFVQGEIEVIKEPGDPELHDMQERLLQICKDIIDHHASRQQGLALYRQTTEVLRTMDCLEATRFSVCAEATAARNQLLDQVHVLDEAINLLEEVFITNIHYLTAYQGPTPIHHQSQERLSSAANSFTWAQNIRISSRRELARLVTSEDDYYNAMNEISRWKTDKDEL